MNARHLLLEREVVQDVLTKLGGSKIPSQDAIQTSLVLPTTNLLWRFAVSVHGRLIRLWQKVGNKGKSEEGPHETTSPPARGWTRGGAQGHVCRPWRNDRVRGMIHGDEHGLACLYVSKGHEFHSDTPL